MNDLWPNLGQHPGAIFVGLSPGGVQWVAYDPSHAPRMADRLDKLWARVLGRGCPDLVAHHRVTPAQSALLIDEIDRLGLPWVRRAVRVGTTFVRGPRWALRYLAEGLALRLTEDHEADIAETCLYPLTDHQVRFGARARTQSIRRLVATLSDPQIHGGAGWPAV